MRIDAGDTAWVLISAALVLFMTPGLALFYGGMVRAKHVLGMLMQNFFSMGLISVIWAAIGYSLAFGGRGALIGNLDFAWLHRAHLEAPTGLALTIPPALFMVYQMMFAIITPALITGAIADRMRFSAWAWFLGLWAILVYSPVAHWVFAPSGWLFKLGALDFAGGTVVHINTAAAAWVRDVADQRHHPQTQKTPAELFAIERLKLQPFNPVPYPTAVSIPVTASSQCWVRLDSNSYSVPPRYAGRKLTLKVYPERLLIWHDQQVIAEHTRHYDRHQKYAHPDHERELLAQRRQGRAHQLLMKFMALSPQAETYHRQLQERRANPQHHVQKIVALSESYGPDKVARALEDALAFHAYSAEYIANILAQRERPQVQTGALHLTRRQDLLDLDLPEPDLSLYESTGGGQ